MAATTLLLMTMDGGKKKYTVTVEVEADDYNSLHEWFEWYKGEYEDGVRFLDFSIKEKTADA